MFDITDPFGKYRRKELEYENRQLVERNRQLEEDAKEHRDLDDFLIKKLNAAHTGLTGKARELIAVKAAYAASEEARKSLGEKNRKLAAENEILTAKLGELCKEISDLKTAATETTTSQALRASSPYAGEPSRDAASTTGMFFDGRTEVSA